MFLCNDRFKQIETTGSKGTTTRNIEDQYGYSYAFHYVKKTGIISWRCSKKTSQKCKARVDTQDDHIIRQTWKHNHGPFDIRKSELPLKIEMD